MSERLIGISDNTPVAALTGTFWKLHACGNSAVMMKSYGVLPTSEQVRNMILRGPTYARADNLLLFSTPKSRLGLDIIVEGFNADGSRVGLCGNGARCLLWLAIQIGELPLRKEPYHMLMDETRITLHIENFDERTVSMFVPPPSFDPETIPFKGDASSGKLSILGKQYDYVVVDVGNPHCVLFTPELLDPQTLKDAAEVLQKDSVLFPEGVNVSVCKIENEGQVRARIYERGVGLTTSSGTGSVAIASAGRSFKGLGEKIEVCMDGGSQIVEWKGGASPIKATTTVTFVTKGEYEATLAH
ncbi:MAG: diaminopimelate epimerase [Bdellovibrionota bacterium]